MRRSRAALTTTLLVTLRDPYGILNLASAPAGIDLSPLSLIRPYNAYFISATLTLPTVNEPRHQRPELPKPWLPLAPPVSSVDSVTGPVSTGVGTNCAILSPDRIS